MKKKHNYIILFLLVFSMLFSLTCFSVSADYQSNSTVSEIQNVIKSIAFEKEHYGFAGVDMSSLWVGDAIPSYVVENNNFCISSNSNYYPILDDAGVLVSMALITSFNGEVATYISSELVIPINSQLKKDYDQSIALIYDCDGVYCWNGQSFSLLALNSASERIASRTSIENIDPAKFENISTIKITKKAPIDISGTSQPMGYGDETAYVNAPVKRQPKGSNWCWAACMASIVEHEIGESYTCEQMAKRYTTDIKTRIYLVDAQRRLNSSFGIKTNICNDNNLLFLFNSLSNDHPVFAGFYDSEYAHAMVVRGIDFGSNTFSVMDPAASGSNYRSGYIINRFANSGTLTIAAFSSNITYKVVDYLYIE